MMFYVISCGFLGVEVGMKFTNFCKTRDKQVNAKDMLKDWKACKAKLGGLSKIDNAKFVDLGNILGDFLKNNKIDGKTADKQVEQIKLFLTDCPPEPRMAAFRNIAQNIENLKKVQKEVSELMVKTINGPGKDSQPV